MATTVVPNRNAILLTIAVGTAIAEHTPLVAVAVHAGDHAVYPDCRPEFIDTFNTMTAAANHGYGDVHVTAPFIHLHKQAIVHLGAHYQVPFRDTWSCYNGGPVHCGRCATCVERIEAFTLAELPDPTDYADTTYAKTLL